MSPVGAYVLGNERVLSPRIVRQLAGAGVPQDQIVRLKGGSRAGTAALIARSMDRRGDADQNAASEAFDAAVIVNPASREAASAAALAAHRRLPVLFVSRDGVPLSTRSALSDLGIRRTLVIGGTRVVSTATARSLPSPKRLGGGDAYATSQAVVSESIARGLPRNIGYVTDAGGSGAFMGAAVARLGGLQILSPNPQATAGAAVDRFRLRREIDRLVVVGGGSVSPEDRRLACKLFPRSNLAGC